MKQKLLVIIFITILGILSFLSYKNYSNLNNSSHPIDTIEENRSYNKKFDDVIKSKIYIDNKNFISEIQILEVRNFISEMKEKYTKLSFDIDFKNRILELYQKNNKISSLLKKTIIDHNFALKLSKDDQNYARIFAIQGLKEIAISGNNEPLISTIQDFSKLLQTKSSVSKGELADLNDLLREYILTNDINEFTENLQEHLITAGFNHSIKNKDIFDIYDQAFYFSLSSKIGKEKTKELLNKYFES